MVDCGGLEIRFEVNPPFWTELDKAGLAFVIKFHRCILLGQTWPHLGRISGRRLLFWVTDGGIRVFDLIEKFSLKNWYMAFTRSFQKQNPLPA